MSFESNTVVLLIMLLYGVISGGSAIIMKIGIFRSGGIKINDFFRDVLPAAWNLLSTPMWFIGGIAALTGFIIYTVALNIYDVSIIKPLVNTNLLFTFIFAAVVFKERLSIIEWVGVGILIVGLLLFALTPNIESNNEMNEPLLLLFLPVTLGLMVAMIVILFIVKKGGSSELILPIFAGAFFGIGTFFTKSLLIGLNGEIQTILPRNGIILYSFCMLIITYGFATIAQQLAFERGRLSIVSPITNALSVTIAFIGAYFVFYEDLIYEVTGALTLQSFYKIFGLLGILIALFILRREIDPLKNLSNTP
ncbi:hypothetical protein CEE45_04505 [Candidatus Heimdallarchaeota archaeon B3_Heim]|nr:MAG: hypothetical protein CEE45_04505 [Candidatus Heimdallarchaeota archaeon B3_Heim]